LEALRDPANDPRSAGLKTWQGILEKLDRGDDEKGEPDAFADLMLREWATEMLLVSKDENSTYLEDSDIYRALNVVIDQPPVKAGTLLRGSSLQVSPFLFQNQFFHKSSILLLQDIDSFSVGLVLNLPTTDSYTIQLDGSTAEFPIRYGGPSGADGEDTLVWLHCSKGLKNMGIGKPPVDGDENSVWTCTLDQVIRSLESGLADTRDFILVQGFCVWEKEEAGSAGGILGQVMSGNFEATTTTDDLNDIWSALLKQTRLTEDSLDTNFQMTINAWNRGRTTTTKDDEREKSRLVFDTNVEVSALADDALLAWIKIYLLGNNEYYV
jgi:hypothetical protein